MKRILISQRVDYVSDRDEHRDALDRSWVPLMLAANLYPVLVANNSLFLKKLLEHDQFDGLLLTGGNSLVAYGGNSAIRDEIELCLLEWAIKHQAPVLGVCRGMQLIQHFYQSPLQQVPNHVGARQQLHVDADGQLARIYKGLEFVTTFHHFGAFQSQPPLNPIAKSADDVVMAIRHESLPIHGVMWHPEREIKTKSQHVECLKVIFGGSG
jgi:putative glutamine amidotransferase